MVVLQDPHTILNFLLLPEAAVAAAVMQVLEPALAVGERLRRPKLVLVTQLQLLLVLEVLEVHLVLMELMVSILKR